MASSGRTTAVTGGTGTQSTPANNVGGADTARRVSISQTFTVKFLVEQSIEQ